MRFDLELELDKPELEKEYRKCILSFIKQALSEFCNGYYKERYFHDTDTKDYTFTVFLKGAKFIGEKIQLADKKIQIRFSTESSSDTSYILLSSFINQKDKSFPLPNKNFMILKDIYTKGRETITSKKVLFRTAVGGGLCIREHDKESNKDKYYTVEDKEFLEIAVSNLKRQAIAFGFTEDIANTITLHPVQCKKIVTKHYGVLMDITIGMFILQGDTDILQYFYDAGAGSRKSSGYGMLDLVTQELD